MQTDNLLISIICPDKQGLVSAITGTLFESGINLGDTTFTILGEGAEFTAICETPSGMSANQLKELLQSIEELQGADIGVKPFSYSTSHKESDKVTHEIILQGEDQPGLVARLTELFADYDANIVRMDTKKLVSANSSEYLIQLWVWIPYARVDACLASVGSTASLLNMRSVSHVAR